MKQISVLSILLVIVSFLRPSTIYAGESNNFITWLDNEDNLLGLKDEIITTVLEAKRSCRVHLLPSPQKNQVAFCLSTDSEQKVQIIDFDEPDDTIAHHKELKNTVPAWKVKQLYAGKPSDNHFAPLSILWSPSGDKLFVKFGFSDFGCGWWFPYDATNGKFLGNNTELEKIRHLSIEERPINWKGNTRPANIDSPEPVWTLDGKYFSNIEEAKKSGYNNLFDIWKVILARESARTEIFWQEDNDSSYTIFLDRVKQRKVGHIFKDGIYQKSMPLRGAIFSYYGKELIFTGKRQLLMKCLWRTSKALGNPKTENEVVKWEYTTHKASISMNNVNLERVYDLGINRLLLEVSTEVTQKWLLIDMEKLATSTDLLNKTVQAEGASTDLEK